MESEKQEVSDLKPIEDKKVTKVEFVKKCIEEGGKKEVAESHWDRLFGSDVEFVKRTRVQRPMDWTGVTQFYQGIFEDLWETKIQSVQGKISILHLFSFRLLLPLSLFLV
jgi:hypothetical protein